MRKAIVTTEITCKAPEGIFGEWDLLPPAMQELFKIPGSSIPCGGQGTMGNWCDECRWGKVEVLEVEHGR